MKQTPEQNEAQAGMQPGAVSGIGFLGTDPRPLRAILEEDDCRVAALGLTHADVAARLRVLTGAARAAFGAPVVAEDIFEVRFDEARGVIPCPWPHPGIYRKGVVYLRRLDTNETLVWTELAVHMIEEHGFYGGTGSPYRLDPDRACRILKLASSAPGPDS